MSTPAILIFAVGLLVHVWEDRKIKEVQTVVTKAREREARKLKRQEAMDRLLVRELE